MWDSEHNAMTMPLSTTANRFVAGETACPVGKQPEWDLKINQPSLFNGLASAEDLLPLGHRGCTRVQWLFPQQPTSSTYVATLHRVQDCDPQDENRSAAPLNKMQRGVMRLDPTWVSLLV